MGRGKGGEVRLRLRLRLRTEGFEEVLGEEDYGAEEFKAAH